jgi:hypothetical protein
MRGKHNKLGEGKQNKLGEGKHNKLGEGERKVRLGQDSLPNIAISVKETSGNYIHCFTQTRNQPFCFHLKIS